MTVVKTQGIFRKHFNITRHGQVPCHNTIQLLTYLLNGAEPFLRSCQLSSYSGTSQHFKESEGSSPCSQEPSTGLYPEPDRIMGRKLQNECFRIKKETIRQFVFSAITTEH
jgi:hypothetical protein